jgi:hypothetical protein
LGHLLFAVLVGLVLVGTSITRTLEVDKGEISGAILSSLLNSVAYYLCVVYVAKDHFWDYIATSVGAMAVVVYLAVKNKKRLKEST